MNNLLTKHFCRTPLNSAVFSWLKLRYRILALEKCLGLVCEWETLYTYEPEDTIFSKKWWWRGPPVWLWWAQCQSSQVCSYSRLTAPPAARLELPLDLSCLEMNLFYQVCSLHHHLYVVPSHPVSVFPFRVRFLKNWSWSVECLCARISDLQNIRIYYVETT